MDISVIVPCYNCERYIRPCLEALLAQSYPLDRYEVILVDNGSTDSSASLARLYQNVTVIEASARGAYAARNAGVRASTGPILREVRTGIGRLTTCSCSLAHSSARPRPARSPKSPGLS